MRGGPEPGRVESWLRYAGLTEGGIAAAFVLGTHALLDLRLSGPLVGLAFCGTALVYQLDRMPGRAPEDGFNQPGRQAWYRRQRRALRVLAGALGGGALGCALHLQPLTLLCALGVAALSGLYLAPLLPGRRRLKAVWFAKPLAIALGWAGGGVILPLLEAGARASPLALALLGARFAFVFPNALVADVPDRRGDARAGLVTMATRWPAQRVRRAAAASALLAVAAGVGFGLRHGGLWWIDLGGPLLMLAALLGPSGPTGRRFVFALDLLVAWPGLGALVAWLGPG